MKGSCIVRCESGPVWSNYVSDLESLCRWGVPAWKARRLLLNNHFCGWYAASPLVLTEAILHVISLRGDGDQVDSSMK